VAKKPPGKEKVVAPLKDTPEIIRPPSPSRLYLIMALVAVLILVGGFLSYYFQEQHLLKGVENELLTAAQLKTEQIAQWRYERLVDANIISQNQFFTEGVADFMASPTDTEVGDKVLTWLTVITKFHSYQDILLVDVNGSVLLSLNDNVRGLGDMTLAQLAVAIKENRAVMTDFHYPPNGDSPHLDVVAPLFLGNEDSQSAIGAVVLCIDPSEYLWPMVQYLPMTSETAETLLVERDGDHVLFLNELRHQQDTALKLRIPLSRQEVPATMAVLGKDGIVEGKDYRGVEVLAALNHVPDSPWYIVTKIDASEALSEWRYESVRIVASVIVVLGAALAAIGFLWQRRQRQAYETMYQAEIESQALRSHFEYLVKYANDIIFLVDEKYKVVEANDRALETYGYTREEMIGMPLTALVAPEDISSYQAQQRTIQQKGLIVAEAMHQRKDGSTFPVELSGRTIKIEEKWYIQEIIRDITERKQAEKKLQHFNLVLRAIRNVNQLIARGVDRESLLKGACENFVNTRGYYNAWIALLDESGKLVTAAEAGLGRKFRQMVERLKHGELPYCGREVLKKSGVVVIEDPASECVDCTLAKDYLGRCGMSVRLEYGGKVYGLMTVSAPSGATEEQEETDLFKEVADDISFALYTMEQEQERERAEAEYRAIIRTAMDGFWLSDMQGHFLDVNEAYCRLIGYSRDELLNMSISDIEAIDKPEDIAKRIRKTKRVGYDRFESRHRRKNGEIVDVEIGVNYLSTDGGRQFVFIRDITGRKRAEEALASEAIRRRILIEQSRDGIVVLDENGKVYEANRRFAEMLGYSPEEVRELNVWDWEFQFPREQVQGMIRSVDEKGDHFETRHRRKDGSTYDVEISTNGAIIAGQKLIFCVCRDITERKQAEEALAKSEERYRSVLEQMEEAYYEVDIAGNFTFVNDATCRQLGYSREELIGMNYRVYTTKDDVQNVYEAFNQVYRTGKPYKGLPVVRIRKGGSWLSTETSAFPLRNERGDIIGFRGIARDVTEYKQAEEALRRSEQNLRDSIESSPLGIRVLDGRWKTLYANQALLNFWGYNSIEELEAVPVKQRYTPEGYAVHVKIVKKRKQGEDIPFNYETSIVRSDGQVRYLSVSTRALLWNGTRQVQAVYQDITERKQAEEQVKKLYSLQTAIRYINESLLKVDDELALFEQVCRFLVDVELIKFCWIGSADMENLRVKPVAYAGFEDGYLSSLKMRIGGSPYDRGPVGMAIKTRQPCTVADIENDSKFKPWREAALARGYASSLAVPLVHDTEVIGVLSVYSGSKNAFGYAEIDFMAEAANDIALGIRTLRLRRELQQSLAGLGKALEGTVSALASVAEVRDPYTSGHQQRVARLAVAIATEMGLPQEQIEGLHVAGTLHDVGKLYVPAEILSKPGKLTEVEFNLVKIHSQASYDILKNVEFPWPIAQIVLQHHERLDGSGYPQGLRGEDILLEARILAVSDVVEAMASHRPYRPALGIGQALDEISQKSGILYDSEVVDACFKLFYDKEFKLD
jgi:PAS domain S-box-containing protein